VPGASCSCRSIFPERQTPGFSNWQNRGTLERNHATPSTVSLPGLTPGAGSNRRRARLWPILPGADWSDRHCTPLSRLKSSQGRDDIDSSMTTQMSGITEPERPLIQQL
jgi:hypothetical protein